MTKRFIHLGMGQRRKSQADRDSEKPKERVGMNHKELIFSGLGIFSTIHHKLVTPNHVWTSGNQAWYQCHGKLGIIALWIGLVIFWWKRWGRDNI